MDKYFFLDETCWYCVVENVLKIECPLRIRQGFGTAFEILQSTKPTCKIRPNVRGMRKKRIEVYRTLR